ncbi:outer membrane protein assembly complex protein, OM_YaeT family [Psychroflexus torquis ATCC 700755]|uniref:Outer membrane protein assembly complex protein, OM_YaeT family n=1 Tax=Psychroflexus torquis (strain ATCC 700755 / CIP 106069 / ACAM 623) TaxID=313595 RepID=K4IDA3_PSYTT|nr:outer membrane protein assembly complex protein, OM_YaeT family [Psychroflexus torquis ATCC 700755]
MEKQVNNSKCTTLFSRVNLYVTALTLMLFFAFANAQQNPQQAAGKKYTLGKIEVIGSSSYNEQTVIAFTGLKEGEELYIPGDRISKVLKKLWDLGLFSDINFYLKNVDGDIADLQLEIVEVPKLNEVKVRGIKKRKRSEIIKDNSIQKNTKITENYVINLRNNIEEKYKEKGFLNAKANIITSEVIDTSSTDNLVNVTIDIETGDKVKISEINIKGNEQFSDWTIKRMMKKTKEKFFLRLWKRSKFIEEEYETDKDKIVKKFKEKGYRDARIVSDSVIVNSDTDITINIEVKEGNRYYFGEIDFLGNSAYTNAQLSQLMGIRKGDPYNGTVLQNKIANNEKPDANDITNLYQNNGYLFSNITPVETRIYNDTIDFEIRINEGKIAYFNEILISGNDKTNDNVIFRNLRTRPGQQYSKQDVMNTIRELGQLGFFNAENLEPEFKNVDPQSGTLDLQYVVEEQGSSQIELQGGYGGGGFIGTLGLRFNNFSLKNIFNKEAYKPVPMGDGQSLSLRAQASLAFQNYSLSFVEPWLGGKKPVQLSVSLSQTIQFLFNPLTRRADNDRSFTISGINVGFAKRLREPDQNFTLSTSIGYQNFQLNNYNIGLFRFPNGTSNNLSFTVGLNRNNTFTNPIFPTGGSEFDFSVKFTLPYSAFNDVDYAGLREQRIEALASNDGEALAVIDQQRFNWLEFYKVKFSGDWYNNLFDKLVLRTRFEYGFLGAYNNDRGIPPFERFFLGGDGLAGFALDGREIIALRGYPNQSILPRTRTVGGEESFNDGASIYNKYTMELRYPITLKPSASIYALAFMEGGATFDQFKDFTPFEMSRSAGAGLRIFMPAFGLLGIDFGYGFDPIPGSNTGPNAWETHFIIGQQF